MSRSDRLEGIENLRFQRFFHRRQRDIGLFAVAVRMACRTAVRSPIETLTVPVFVSVSVAVAAPALDRHVVAAELAAVGGVQVDDVAQEHRPVVERVVPGQNGTQSQRALADRADHAFAPGLDPLGDGDLALARQQLDAAHFAQIHPHRVVRAPEILVLVRARGQSRACGGFPVFGRDVLGILALDDVDAKLGKIGHRVFDLLGRNLIGRKRGIQLVVGDEAALLAARDQFLDQPADRIDQGRIGVFFLRGSVFRRARRFRGHRRPCRYVPRAAESPAAPRSGHLPDLLQRRAGVRIVGRHRLFAA